MISNQIRLIVEYLCTTGQSPAFFEMKNPINPNAFKRRKAYLLAMERLGLEAELIQVDGDGWNFEEVGFVEGKRVLEDGHLRTNTLLCSNDRLAIGVLSAAFESGIPLPGLALVQSLYLEAKAHNEGKNGNQSLFKTYYRITNQK